MDNKKKKFIITIDTEGDNLWGWKEGMPLHTENTLFIPRFQDLCEKYHFIPTWLCNWEMLNDDRFVNFARKKLQENKCAIGMHLHAWNTPPYYELPRHEKAGLPYLIEYPREIMEEKIKSMTSVIVDKLGVKPIVHRAGRWAMNDIYFELLSKYGYIADCSITPYVDWKNSYGQTPGFAGPNYYNEKVEISKRKGILEIPVTTLWNNENNKVLWLRPNRKNLEEMLYLIEWYKNSDYDYLMFMLHSSEMMPGGSPTFLSEGGIGILYEHLEVIFKEIAKFYDGIGLDEYALNILDCEKGE